MLKQLYKSILVIASVIVFLGAITVVGKIYYDEKGQEKDDTREIDLEEWLNDGCEGHRTCQKCKRNSPCLQCMHDCYNRYGSKKNKENPFKKKATTCNIKCWEAKYKAPSTTGFKIEMKKIKNYKSKLKARGN